MPDRKMTHIRNISIVLSFLLIIAEGTEVAAQTEWLKDASGAKIPAGPIKGVINGKSATLTKGRLSKSGGMKIGSEEFPHYTLSLSDAESGYDSRFSTLVTIVVRKGELPDGKTFRADLAPPETRAGLRGDGYWIPELYSVFMSSRGGEEFGTGTDIVSAKEEGFQATQDFTGRVEIDRRKGGKITARLYICYNDTKKSWIAGTIDLEVE